MDFAIVPFKSLMNCERHKKEIIGWRFIETRWYCLGLSLQFLSEINNKDLAWKTNCLLSLF